MDLLEAFFVLFVLFKAIFKISDHVDLFKTTTWMDQSDLSPLKDQFLTDDKAEVHSGFLFSGFSIYLR